MNPFPLSCFGELAAEYIERNLLTTFILDESDWLHFDGPTSSSNCELLQDLGQKTIEMSVGTAGFIASIEERSEPSSDEGTVFECSSPEDVAELQRLVLQECLHVSNHQFYM